MQGDENVVLSFKGGGNIVSNIMSRPECSLGRTDTKAPIL